MRTLLSSLTALLILGTATAATGQRVEVAAGGSIAAGNAEHVRPMYLSGVVSMRGIWDRGGYGIEAGGGVIAGRPLTFISDYYGPEEGLLLRTRALVGLRTASRNAWYVRVAAGVEGRFSRYGIWRDDGRPGEPVSWHNSLAPMVEPGFGWRSHNPSYTLGVELSVPIAFHKHAAIMFDSGRGTSADLLATVVASW